MIPIFSFTLDTQERIGQPITFEATDADARVLLEAFACYYHDDLGTVQVSDGRQWQGHLILGGDSSFDAFVSGLS